MAQLRNASTYKASGAMQGIYAQWVDDVEVVRDKYVGEFSDFGVRF